MTLQITHNFQSEVADSPDTSLVQPSHWNDLHGVEMATGFMLGRLSAGDGPVEELSAATIISWLGATLGGAGDASTNTSVSVDGEIALFSGTTGKLLKRAAGSGIVKVTSGVLGYAVAADFPTLNQNTTGLAAGFTGSLSGDVSGSQGATVVNKINGVALSGLATGILKNTTSTGAVSIAVAGTDYVVPSALGTAAASSPDGSTLEISGTTLRAKDGGITNTKLANAAANTFKGNNTGASAAPVDMSVAQAKTLLALAKADVGLSNVDNTSDATKNSATATLTNKRVTQRVFSEASNAAPSPNSDSYDQHDITALAAAATFSAPSGAPTDGQTLVIRIKDNGTARGLTWNAAYRAGSDIPLPTTTVISKTLYVLFIYNSADSKWDLVGVVNNI